MIVPSRRRRPHEGETSIATFFVVNPAAGRGRARKIWEQVRSLLARWTDWDVAFTEAPGCASDLARAAAARGFDRVVAVGGDGTLHEVTNGLVNTQAALGLIPAGTGNDFARVCSIPKDPEACVRLVMTGEPVPVDVGEVQTAERRVYFLNVAGLGFDAEVARAVNAYPKYLGGTVPYLFGVVKTLWSYSPAPVELEVDGRLLRRRTLLIAVGVGRAYGGGMLVLPQAILDDGLLDICVAGDFGRMETLRIVPKLYDGGHVGHPKVEFLRCRSLKVHSDRAVAVHADGEVVGSLPATFRIHPRALRVVVGGLPRV